MRASTTALPNLTVAAPERAESAAERRVGGANDLDDGTLNLKARKFAAG